MQHEQFDSVSVPIGVWEVGVDIPEGTWILTSTNGSFVSITYGSTLEENGNSMNEFDRGNTGQNIDDDQSWKVVARKGNYFEIKYDNVTFTSDTGSIGLGFKKRN
jgi:hypothetical protein